MTVIQFELSEDDERQFNEAAASSSVSPASLAQRWVQDRLLHERDRAAGRALPMSPQGRAGLDPRSPEALVEQEMQGAP